MTLNGSKFLFETTADDPHLVQRSFVPDRLTLARELAGLNKRQLADEVGVKPSAISQFESSSGVKPSADTLARIALKLQVRVRFFAIPVPSVDIQFEDCHFRARRSVSQVLRRQAIANGIILLDVLNHLSEEFEFPNEQVSWAREAAQGAHSPQEAGELVREAWGMGLGPVPSVWQHLEHRGIRVLPLSDTVADVDAFSCWADGVPAIFSAPKSSSRMQFDLAHELGHLVMHEDAEAGDPELELQANQFASAFLMPKESFKRECPHRWDREAFFALKKRWHVSVQALLHRARTLNLITPSTYKYASIQLGPVRTREPGEWADDHESLVLLALDELEAESSPESIADKLGLSLARYESLLRPFRIPANERASVEDKSRWT